VTSRPGGPTLAAERRLNRDQAVDIRRAPRERLMAAAEDPVCGMQVDTDTDLKTEYDGETFYFCSRGCLLDFQEDPEKYLDPEYEPNM
jgi:YHS domain-containing protein